jgi:hypothetical protein
MNERLQQLYKEQKQLHIILDKVRLNEINREIYAINEQLKQERRKQRQIEKDIATHNKIDKLLSLKERNKNDK